MKLLFKNIFRSFQAYIKIKCQKKKKGNIDLRQKSFKLCHFFRVNNMQKL